MTVPNQSSYIGPNQGNGATTDYVFNGRFDNTGDLVVQQRLRAAPFTITTMSLNADYSLIGVGPPYLSGAIIRFIVPPPATVDVLTSRISPLAQTIPIGNQIDLPSSSIELGLDRAVLTLQEMQDQISLALRRSLFTNANFNMVLPSQLSDPSSQGLALVVNSTNNGFALSQFNPDLQLGAAAASANSAQASAASATAAQGYSNNAATSAANSLASAASAAASAAAAVAVGNGVLTTKGDIVVYGSGTAQRLAVGADGLPIIADSAQTKGIRYGTIGTNGITANAITDALLAHGAISSSIVILEDREPYNSAGGTSTGSAWNTRVLNTKALDRNGDCTLNGDNTFQLSVGNWFAIGVAPAYQSNGHQLRLYDVTGADVVLRTDGQDFTGRNCWNNNSNYAQTEAWLIGRFNVASAAHHYSLQHWITTGLVTQGLGVASVVGNSENITFAQIILIKEA